MAKTIQTPCGAITGTTCQWPGVISYRGIRYATAGRWEYPTVVTHWEGTYDATQYGACSYQPRAFYDEAQMPEKAFYYNEFRKGEHYDYSEDCLFLNIWTPEDAGPDSRLPVIFYIHGGGFTGGCGHEKHFDGPVWPTKGVIGVTINYRLGPMGFVCLPELAEESGRTGNYALYDQLAALQWVHDNISAFGGDPANVTLMGQSAGAMSVQQLVLSPLVRGLAAKAVMSSAGGVNKMFDVKPAADNYSFWQGVMARAGCADLAAFRALPPDALFAAWQAEQKAQKAAGMSCAPCLDGNLIPCTNAESVKSGSALNIPYLLGTNSEDIMPPIIFRMAKGWCRLQADQGRQPSYTWFFDRQLPGDDCGAWHSSDLWYWFGTLDHCWRPMTDHDWALTGEMTDYLTNFAKTGDPNGAGLTQWLPIQKGQSKVLRLGQGVTHMGGVNMAKLTHTMMTKPAVGE
ncbi:MAG: carboxylesterase family protein [Clostridiales bacterium]|nr:carboxylesterase family protein [Clostridiales bacterium]